MFYIYFEYLYLVPCVQWYSKKYSYSWYCAMVIVFGVFSRVPHRRCFGAFSFISRGRGYSEGYSVVFVSIQSGV